jgi:hypothetical protein
MRRLTAIIFIFCTLMLPFAAAAQQTRSTPSPDLKAMQ